LKRDISKKTRSQEVENINSSLHNIMGTMLDFRNFLHDGLILELGSLLQKYKGKADSEWTEEDIKEFKRLRRLQKTKIPLLQQAVDILQDARRKMRNRKRK